MSKEVAEAMQPYFIDIFGNASSKFYGIGRKAERALHELRQSVAKSLNAANPNEIYFTGSSCEADNWAIKGVAFANQRKGNHIITSKIEHHAILNTCEYLEKHGFEVTYLDVDEYGVVDPKAVEAAITDKTILISIMTAHNEIGAIEPIAEIAKIAKAHKVIFHTDAVQAFGQLPINVDECHIDMLSASGHKINGSKGIGFLYIRKGVKIRSFVHGGAQERQRRAGTLNVPGIVGMGKAAEIAAKNMEESIAYQTKLRDHLIARVMEEIPYTKLNGHPIQRLANNANFCFRFIEGESMLILLDQSGVCGSSGSACTSGSLDPSHVLLAIGLPHEIAHGSLRLTLSNDTTLEDIDFVVDRLKGIIEHLRSMSPLYEDFVKHQK